MDTRGEVPHIVSSILFILKFYFPALLRYDWHTTLCQFKVYNVIIWYTYTYCKMTTINLVNTSITLYNYYFVWVWWEYLRSIYSEKAMAPHSSTLAWKIPWMEEPGRVQSMGLLRVGHDWATSLSLFTFHFHALEKEMATHSSVLAWRIPGKEEPGGLPSMGSHRVKHDWSDLVVVVLS